MSLSIFNFIQPSFQKKKKDISMMVWELHLKKVSQNLFKSIPDSKYLIIHSGHKIIKSFNSSEQNDNQFESMAVSLSIK